MKVFVKNLIDRIIKDSKLSAVEISSALGISTQAFYNYKNGKTKYMNFKNLTRLRKVSGYSWAKFGELLDKEYLK